LRKKKKVTGRIFIFAKGGFRAPSCGRGPLLVRLCPFLLNFLTLFYKKIGKFGERARPFERMDVQHPHFLKLVPTLGSIKSSIPHGAWGFHFLSKKIG
jgi:hypothetical protein